MGWTGNQETAGAGSGCTETLAFVGGKPKDPYMDPYGADMGSARQQQDTPDAH